VGNWPISLIDAFAKLVSKILASRQQPRLDELVSPCQSAFTARRNIQDNYLYVQSLAKLLKLDLAKAFDTVSWAYLLDMMRARGFPRRWQDWMAILFGSATSRPIINGVTGRPIVHRRGLRQGDSMSPFLFVLVMEPLHKLLDLATDAGILSRICGKKCTFRASL
jgi:mannosylglycoprotein endo-beta-mannosidase